MQDYFEIICEQRIQQAIARGDFKDLPGTGKPLKIRNLHFLPPELRAAYTVLKNSGYLNPSIDDKKHFPSSKES